MGLDWSLRHKTSSFRVGNSSRFGAEASQQDVMLQNAPYKAAILSRETEPCILELRCNSGHPTCVEVTLNSGDEQLESGAHIAFM